MLLLLSCSRTDTWFFALILYQTQPFNAGRLDLGPDNIPQKKIRYRFCSTVQQLLGHSSIETTKIYLHAMRKPGAGLQSPEDL